MSGNIAKIAALVVLGVMFLWFGSLTSKPLAGGPRKIIALELAPTTDAANRFLDSWSKALPDTWKTRLRESLEWDTWFICAYAAFFALLSWVAAEHFGNSGYAGLASFGKALTAGLLLAGALDFAENAAMSRMIEAGRATAPWPQVSFAASLPKWILLGLFSLFAVAAGVHWAIGLVKR